MRGHHHQPNLNDVDYIVQAMTSAIASAGDELGAVMRRAGFRYVFLGIENVLDQDLAFLKAKAKNARRESGRTTGSATYRAVELLHRHGLLVVGGLIVGNPSDTEASIQANLDFARKYVDWPYIQHPTPYPGTPMTKDFREKSLIVNEEVDEYDGTTAVVRTEHLSRRRHRIHAVEGGAVDEGAPPAGDAGARSRLRREELPPHAASQLPRDDFRTWLGLESQRDAFRRYKAIRRAEREFFPDMSASASPGPTIRRQASTGKPSELVAQQTSPGRRISV